MNKIISKIVKFMGLKEKIRYNKDLKKLKGYRWRGEIFNQYIMKCNREKAHIANTKDIKDAISQILLYGEEQQNHSGRRSFVGYDSYSDSRIVVQVNTFSKPMVAWVGLADRNSSKYDNCKMERGAL